MTEDILTGIINEFFAGGWRVAPFIKTPDGYIGVKAWPKRAATNVAELQALIDEQAEKSSKVPIFGIVPSAGQYVVDIDTKKNASALQLWKDRVNEAYGDLSLGVPKLVVKTKSGGFHLYYSDGTDRKLHSPTSIFSKDSGIDIRGYTGMVVAPTGIGTSEDWQLGEYIVIRGRPTDSLTVLGLSKILGDSYDEQDTFVELLLSQVNEALRNDSVNETKRYMLIPDSLIIPSSSRDNTLYRCARLCRLAGLSQDSALIFMAHVAKRCEASAEEPIEHWIALAADKVKRVYASETEMKMQTVSGFFSELDNSGVVLLRGVAKSYYYFRHGSKILRISPRSKYSTDNIGNVLQGVEIQNDEGSIPCKKVIGSYMPKEVAYADAMFPKAGMPMFEYEGQRYVNTYHDPFAAFEPNPEIMDKARPFIQKFNEFVQHITGYEDGDDGRLLDKLAWIVQRPYRRLPTATIIYSRVRGTGKDNFMGLIREIIGRKYYMPIDLGSIENPHTLLHDKIVCTASEIQMETNARGSKGASTFMGQIKDKITAKHAQVDEKFVQAYNAPLFTNFFLLSNFELGSILEPGDRRFDVFHTAEEKFDQERFGELADIANDGIWIERSEQDKNLRAHVVYALRRALMERAVGQYFDREEAVMNEVKQSLMQNQNPPAIDWLRLNLPVYFTEDIVMMACQFCPMKLLPEYAMKQLREHFGPAFHTLRRGGRTAYRMNGSPKYERRSDGSGGTMPVMEFNIKTSDVSARRQIHFFEDQVREQDPNDSTLRAIMNQWYVQMTGRYYGNTNVLPAQKPDVKPDVI